MKTLRTEALISLLAIVLSADVVRAGLYTEAFTGINTAIPDGNPVGVSFSELVSDVPDNSMIDGLTVNLSVSGGYNGNLFAYLVAPNGAMVTLLDHPGTGSGDAFGYSGSGLNITLSDTADGNIQTSPETSGLVFSGIYQAADTLGALNGSLANGKWTLYCDDDVSGGGQRILNSWSLSIATVPEPANITLMSLGLGFMGIIAFRRRRIQRSR